MTTTHRILVLATLTLFAACKAGGAATAAIVFDPAQNPEVTVAEEAPKEQAPKEQAPKAAAAKTKAAAQDPAKAKQDAAKKREAKTKELRQKRRELAHADVEAQIAKIDRAMQDMTLAMEVREASIKLREAKAALNLFLEKQKPRELEEHRISLDRSTHRADHAKDEFDELTAMYEADEFAKATKELVLKRGRRSLEIATRELAVAKKRDEEFQKHTLPRRENELRAKQAAAEIALRKAQMSVDKAQLKAKLADTRHAEKLSDLREDIAKLEKELATAKSAAARMQENK